MAYQADSAPIPARIFQLAVTMPDLLDLLNIYDDDDNFVAKGADTSRSADHSIGVSGGAGGFVKALDSLVAKGMTFKRAVISTHGGEGHISFGGERISAGSWAKLAGRGYEKIFPFGGRIYFPGCRVAGSEEGWQFLESAGRVLLRTNGGVIFAHTSLGFAVGGPVGRVTVMMAAHLIVPFNPLSLASDAFIWFGLKGKVVHPNPWDDVKGVLVSPGGVNMHRIFLD